MRNKSGFTLIELATVLLIIAVIGVIAIPLWVNWLPSYRLQSASRDLFSSFQKAKMEAARRGADVVIAFNPVADTYIMFVDDGNGGGTPNDFIRHNDELLIENSSMPDNVALVSTNFAGVPADVAGFNSRGLPSRGVIGRVDLNNTNGAATSVFLTLAGHIRLAR